MHDDILILASNIRELMIFSYTRRAIIGKNEYKTRTNPNGNINETINKLLKISFVLDDILDRVYKNNLTVSLEDKEILLNFLSIFDVERISWNEEIAGNNLFLWSNSCEQILDQEFEDKFLFHTDIYSINEEVLIKLNKILIKRLKLNQERKN